MRLSPALAPLVLAVIAAARASADDGPSPVLTEATYAAVRDHVVPTAEELAYRKLGWRPTLWQAAVEAQKADRPILLWAMNGHPLACT